MTDIELITTNDLIEELKKRFAHLFIVYTAPTDGQGDKGDAIQVIYDGGAISCLGLSEYGRKKMYELINCDCELMEDDEFSE